MSQIDDGRRQYPAVEQTESFVMTHLNQLVRTATTQMAIAFMLFLTAIFRLFTVVLEQPAEVIDDDTFVDCVLDEEDVVDSGEANTSAMEDGAPIFTEEIGPDRILKGVDLDEGPESVDDPREGPSGPVLEEPTIPIRVHEHEWFRFTDARVDPEVLREHLIEPLLCNSKRSKSRNLY
ncbi:unnamed protein product [Calypogeia fissa]